MPAKSVKVANIQPNTAVGAVLVNVELEKKRGLALVNPLVQELGALQITNDAEYTRADGLLGKIRGARKAWGGIWGVIQEKVIKKQREALDGLYAVNRDVDGPLERGEKFVKSEMALYKDAERKRLQAAEDERIREAERTQALIEQTRAKLETARGSAKAVLSRNLNRMETHQQAVIETVETPVMASNSSSRVVKVLKMSDPQELIAHLMSEPMVEDPAARAILAAMEAALQSAGRTQAEKERLSQWPGVGLVDATQIVGH